MILPGCDKGKDQPTPTSESAPSTDLKKSIRAKLESDDAVKQANLSVKVDVNDNKATLSGTVVSQDLRSKAIDLAKSAQPGLIVEDKIVI